MPALQLRSHRGGGPPASLSKRSDAELIALAGQGSVDAFGLIYDRHCAVAYSLAYRICRSREASEEVVQDAFLSLWRSRDRYDSGRGELRTWLLGMVRNSSIDRLRRSGVRERHSARSEELEEQLEAAERTEDEVQQREQRAEVRVALDTLPAEQRRVIELAYFGGLTHREIASQLGQPVGSIKGRMRLGLAKLQAQLAMPAATQDRHDEG
jgi:RNA polymerase sigma-70 factor (ECF subfamily)